MKFLLPLACTLLLAGCTDSTTTETVPANNEPQSLSAPSSSETNQTSDATAPAETPLPQEAATAPSAADTKPLTSPTPNIQKTAPVPISKAPAASIDAGTLFSQKCASCHGSKGEKSALGKSQIIAGFSESQIKEALHGYQAGTYGKEMKALMQGQAKGLSDSQIDALAHYIPSF